MHLKRAPAVAALALASAFAVAACGNDQQFIDGYNKATRPLSKLNTDIGGAVSRNGEDPKAVARQFDRLASTSAKVNRDLADLDAPDDAKDDFERLKAGLKKGETDLRAVADAARARDSRRAGRAGQALVKDGDAITKAEDAVKAKVEN